MAAKKTAAKKPAAKKTAPAKKKKATTGRKPNAAFMAPMTPSEQLAQVIGSKPLPRTEVTRKVWDYIKKNGLQDGRNIKSDDKLKSVFNGKKEVTMFEMTSLVNKHLSKS